MDKTQEVREAIAATEALIRSYHLWADDKFVKAQVAKEEAIVEKAMDQIAVYHERHAKALGQIATLEKQLEFQQNLLVKVKSGDRVARLMKLMAEVQRLQAEMEAD